ncbi:uncharacterized protein I303_101908 [Kwoniella dejecticola CBS 10117]|uniref:Uncharacterized protein n=1 Tax=Kwoniella dejecticola CBS 10117 TaxID=1296121 RepID=A0A1A6ACF9_9TREE|nr:uncharacterized protein I303_01956 [Kwoniella dejecticola CBS 10117]OBR87744.1 hypothetical protein I303_01956 [Kwoniella dejecticola CBS 10117]
MTPHKHAQHRSARKAVPSTFLNDSFESLINSATTYGSQRGDYEPLHVISTPGRLNTSRSGIEPEGHGAKSTPPTPDFGGSILPQPLFSSSANDPLPVLVPEAGEDKTFDHSVDSYDLEAETSFDRRQNDLYDEVLTSWDLPPLSLSRSNSLVLGKITDPTHLKRNLSKSTGLLESRPALPPQIASSILHSPASSSYPIRAVPSQNRLGDAHVDVESRELGRRGKRKLSDKVKKAVEALEGQHMDREATESPPTPWKRMASLLQPKSSESSLSLREETKRMMCEAREKRSRMRLQKQ